MRLIGGNVGVGTTTPGAKLEVNGSIKLTSGVGGSMTYSDGTVQSTAWTGVLSGGDYAESVDIAAGKAELGSGDLIVIDHTQIGKFVKSSSSYSTLIGGVYATKPGVTGRRQPGSPPSTDEIANGDGGNRSDENICGKRADSSRRPIGLFLDTWPCDERN